MDSDQHRYYAEIIRTTSRLNAFGATAIWLATLAAVWGDVADVTAVGIGLVVTLVANIWIDQRGLEAFGTRIEVVRAIFNASIAVAVGFITSWPAPMWIWSPFVALAFDRSGGKYSFAVVALMLGAHSIGALLDGVGFSYPLASIVLTVYAWRIAEARVGAIRAMLARSDEQRAELEAEVAARQRVEIELRAAQKLEALGRIAAGVAHEINTPIQYVGDSISFLQQGVPDVLALCELNAAVRTAPDEAARAGAIDEAVAAEEAADLGYLVEHVPQALARAREGVDRVAAIVRSMKQFAHGDTSTAVETDLNQAIVATLTIARHEYKLVADVETALGDIPRVTCNAGEINQVLLNIVVNAAHAIADVVGDSGQRGTIRVTTEHAETEVVIAISDTGTGIPETIRDRVFDPFFTTKPLGKGTGQGLAIAQAIVERHRGKLAFETAVGRGTTFTIRLPIGRPSVLALAS